ncbi:ABC transporter permease [Paenibacillus doosanensis]|uniref:ABC transporter permease n=1 Tax=Paenibacillus doosanensis TaxID=1229154 RepID=UPI00217FA7F8|nr:ABC transporter permease [Paenibacillus doosanensis]MCS7464253.1 ABC transporter permease [Paenibacillus doosanensis]
MVLKYSGLLRDLTIKDFKSKYASSHLGILWNILMPICYILIYTLIFSKLMMAKLPQMTGTFDYSIYLSSGILAWTIFNNSLIRLQNVFIENSNIVKKVYFPKVILLLAIICSSLIELFINYVLLFIVLLLVGQAVSFSYLLIFPLLVLLQIFALGVGLILCVTTIHFRDLSQIFSIVLPLWFWFTPIVYVKDIIPKEYQYFIDWNPLYYFIRLFQDIVFNKPLDGIDFVSIILITLGMVLVGSLIYKKLVNEVSDLI